MNVTIKRYSEIYAFFGTSLEARTSVGMLKTAVMPLGESDCRKPDRVPHVRDEGTPKITERKLV